MDQTPLPWEYLEGRSYETKGNKTVWAKSRQSGWGKRQATMQFTTFADGVARVLPLMIFRGKEYSKTTVRKCYTGMNSEYVEHLDYTAIGL